MFQVEFESDEYPKAKEIPESIYDVTPDVALVNLDEHENIVDVEGVVPTAGLYVFVVHYYQVSTKKNEISIYMLFEMNKIS